MKRQLREFRLHALGLAIVATSLGCVTPASRALPELSTQQTVNMVRVGQFAELNRYYAAVQARYDKGSISDERLRSAFRHFYDTSPDLAPRYASWVKEMPDSYAAHLARAIYYLRVGQESRGDRFLSDTSEKQISGMEAAFSVASGELQESFSLEKKPLLSVFYALDIGKLVGDAGHNQALFQASLAMDRRNFIVREMYMETLRTAWGGSTDQMRAFVAESRTAGLSSRQLKDLEGSVFTDEAWIDEFRDKNYKRAAAEYLEAADISGEDGCLYCAGRVLVKAEDFPAAATVLTQYLARNPNSVEALKVRVYVYYKLGRFADERHDYERMADLGDAFSEYALGSMYLAGEFGLTQDRTTAIKWLTLAAAHGSQDAKKLLPMALDKRITIVPDTRRGSKGNGQ
jgi:tetratricopeptide (TPR) repeat protein